MMLDGNSPDGRTVARRQTADAPSSAYIESLRMSNASVLQLRVSKVGCKTKSLFVVNGDSVAVECDILL